MTLLTTRKSPIFDGNLDAHDLITEYSNDLVSFIEVPYCNTAKVAARNAADTNPSKIELNSWRPSLRRLSPFLLDRRAIWFLRVIFNFKKIFQNKDFDIVVSSFPVSYSHLIAFIVSKKLDIPWLADYRDPWSCDTIRRAPWPFYLIDWLIEKSIMKRTARISAVSPGQAKLIGNFLNRTVDVIYNGSDDPNFASINGFRPTSDGEIRTIRYLGTVHDNKIHAYKELFAALAIAIRSEPGKLQDLRFEFIGPRAETLHNLIESFDLQHLVKTKSSISATDANRLMRESAALLLFDVRSSFKIPGVLSGKIFDYLTARRPILNVGDNPQSDINRLIRECEAGFFFDTSKESTGLLEVLDQILVPTASVSPNYTKLAEFRRSVQSERALSILKEMVGQ